MNLMSKHYIFLSYVIKCLYKVALCAIKCKKFKNQIEHNKNKNETKYHTQ